MATSAEIKSNNNTLIRIKTTAKSITKANVADQLDASIDYTVQEISTVNSSKENSSNKSLNVTTDGASDVKYPSVKAVKTYVDANISAAELLINKSINVTTDGASDVKYPSVKAVKTYVDANAGVVAKTSGAITLSATPTVLPYDTNSCSFTGGIAYLPATTEINKEIYVIATANNIEIRANAANTNRMFVTFNTFVSNVILTTNQMYRFIYIDFGGYWKAELI